MPAMKRAFGTPANFLSSLRYRVPLKALEHLICYRKSIDG